MAYVDDFDKLADRNAVKNLVAISAENFHANAGIGGHGRCEGVFADFFNCTLKGSQYVSRPGRASLVEKPEDVVDIGKRPRTVADLHARPWRFQNALASSSDTKAPRRASAITSRSSSLNM